MTERVSLVGGDGGAFKVAEGFEAGDGGGGLTLGKFEAQYEELFAEVIEDGIITVEERQRLDRAADLLGLDKGRLQRLEAALQRAYETHNRVKIVVQERPSLAGDPNAARASLSPIQPTPAATQDPAFIGLQKRVTFLEARVRDLEGELEEARSNVAVEIDLGGMSTSAATASTEDPADLQRRIRQDPSDPEPMHALFRIFGADPQRDLDKQWCVASALVQLGKATADEKAVHAAHRTGQLPRPTTAVSSDAWRRLLFHPDEELLTGDIFAVITSAVLLGRVSALRRDKLLPKLDPARRQDFATTTISAVRAIGWGAAILGLKPAPTYVDPDAAIGIELVPGVPPNLRVGSKLLSGRLPLEVAFEAGRAQACFREEHFIRWIFPGVTDLEDLFLAALTIGSPSLPIPPGARARVEPIAGAISPVLEPAQVDRLRGYFLRFVEEGGRTNLQRWAQAVDRTACRAGLLLCNDLHAAAQVLSREDTNGAEKLDDLISFSTSDRWFALRRQVGICVGVPAGAKA
ncbi:MAG: hypothetical protein ACHREM_02755 [Polyangiales bacterium]